MTPSDFSAWLSEQTPFIKSWIATTGYKAEPGSICFLPDTAGKLSHVLCGIAEMKNFWVVGNLSMLLPEGQYHFDHEIESIDFAIAWGLGAYQFTDYKKSIKKPAQLVIPKNDSEQINTIVESIYLVRFN